MEDNRKWRKSDSEKRWPKTICQKKGEGHFAVTWLEPGGGLPARLRHALHLLHRGKAPPKIVAYRLMTQFLFNQGCLSCAGGFDQPGSEAEGV